MSRPASTNALEQSVMDLWEAGRSMQQIAQQLAVSLGTVQRVMGYMLDRHEQPRAERAMAMASAQLASAIAAARVRA